MHYSYDAFYRANQSVKVGASTILNTSYSFTAGAGSNTTTLLPSVLSSTYGGSTKSLSYTYDSRGNIVRVSENGAEMAHYYYDDLNELIREDSRWFDKTIAYSYDKGGNLQTVKEYGYTTAASLSSLTPTHPEP